MHLHLRYIKTTLVSSGTLLFVTSCSSNKIEPLPLISQSAITYEIRIFEVSTSQNVDQKSAEILSAAEGARLIKKIGKEPSYLATTSGNLHQKKTLTNKTKFIYPTVYDPPQFPSKKAGENATLPVTPAIPRNFVTTKIGNTATFTSSEELISVTLDRKSFLGFINYGNPITTQVKDFFGRSRTIILTENKIEMPVFQKDKPSATTKLRNGEFLVLRNPMAIEPDPGKRPYTEHKPPGFVAMIRATKH